MSLVVTQSDNQENALRNKLRDQPLIIEDLRVNRGASEIIKGITVDFDPTVRYLILGPSGSGKSTLLRLLNRLEDPNSGILRFGPTDLRELPVLTLRRLVSIVPQDPRPLPGTLGENLRYPSAVVGKTFPPTAELEQALDEFGIPGDALDRRAETLSGGEQRRLAIAVALQMSPLLLVLDEPTAGLDPGSAIQLIRSLDRRAERDQLRTIVVTHDRKFGPQLGTTALVLEAGRIRDRGPTADVLDRADAGCWSEAQADPKPVGATS